MKQPVKILVLVDWYEPGFKGGGITRSVINFVQLFKFDFDIYVVTTNSDFGSEEPYEGVQTGEWIKWDGVSLYYAKERNVTYSFLAAQVKSIEPSVVYLNSMFSLRFAILPAIIKRTTGFKAKLLLAPRGSLKQSALSTKAPKKKLFLALFKAAGLHREIHFQATDEQELSDIRRVFGEQVNVILMPDLPTLNIVSNVYGQKVEGILKLVFVGRAHPIKNLDFVLDVLAATKRLITLDVVITREDIDYLQKCESMIRGLPPNISVNVHENVPHAEVLKILARSNVFILPTKGENFGHAIFEALFIGLPVIISDQTPWQNLAKARAGFVCSLDDFESYVQSICFFHDMNENDFNIWRQGAKEYAQAFLRNNPIKEPYKSFIS